LFFFAVQVLFASRVEILRKQFISQKRFICFYGNGEKRFDFFGLLYFARNDGVEFPHFLWLAF
jgi:hypothetical protein